MEEGFILSETSAELSRSPERSRRMPAQNQTKKGTLKNKGPEGQEVQVIKREPLNTLLTWEAPERPFKKQGREYFTTIGAIVFLLAVILLFLQEWLLIAVIIALVFVSYVMATIEPQKVKHAITNRGIVTGERNYSWQELGRFWINSKWNQKILNVTSFTRLPGVLQLLLGDTSEEQVKKLLSDYLPFEEPEKTWMDKASGWLSRRVPLEKTD